jgi:DNA-binding MarR family transcriptional regulator
MQILTDARIMDDEVGREPGADPAAVDAVLTASRSLVAVATRSLGAAAEETTIAQYRALVVLASRGPQRIVDLAEALDVAPSTAGRMGDRLVRKGLVRRHRARGDRRAVLVSVTPAGRQVVDEATARRRALIADILGRLPASGQRAVAQALRKFADAAGEVPDDQWPPAVLDLEGTAPRLRPPVQGRYPQVLRDRARGQR